MAVLRFGRSSERRSLRRSLANCGQLDEIESMEQSGVVAETPESETQANVDSIWGILAEATAAAPRRAKVAILTTLLAVIAAVVIDGPIWITSAGPRHEYRFWGLVFGVGGLFLLTVGHVLHSVSQQESVGCAGFRMQLRSRVLDRIFLALPVLAVVAASLLAVSIALYIPSLVDQPSLLIVVGLFGLYFVHGLRTVSHTSRFLYRHAHEQAAAAARARAEATEAQLAALQAQMNPHFLFNALNTVASLIRTDRKAAETTVENLAGVLRRTLDRSRHTMSTLWDEIDYLKSYLAVEQERWGDRLRVEWAIGRGTLDLQLPPMTLQPLVENALKHGIGEQLEGGILRIGAARENGRLSLSVSDDGAGFPTRYAERTGLGNLRKRLTTLYGSECELRVENQARGSKVVVEIPVGYSGVNGRAGSGR